MRRMVAQLPLSPFPQPSVHDRLVLPWMALLPVPNLADIDRIGEQLVESATREAAAAGSRAAFRHPDLRDDAAPIEILLQEPNGAKF